MNRFPKLMQHIVKLNILGSDLIKTHRALTNLNTRNLDAVYKEQEHRIEEFEKTMEHAINDWNREDLNKYWKGHS